MKSQEFRNKLARTPKSHNNNMKSPVDVGESHEITRSRSDSTPLLYNGYDTFKPLNNKSSTESSPQSDTKDTFFVKLNKGTDERAKQLKKWNLIMLMFALIVFFIFFNIDIVKIHHTDAQKCLALLLLVSILWGSEAIPLWVTSLCIPFVVICGEIMLDDTQETAAKTLLNDLMDPTVILILGGFTIASALHKYNLDTRLSCMILSKAANSTVLFLFVLMILGVFLSMFVSNVASPVLLVFLISPMLRNTDEINYIKAISFGISISCNIGGMATPIASPQNAVAVAQLSDNGSSINFLQWLSVGAPFCFCLVFIAYLVLLVFFKPHKCKPVKFPDVKIDKMTWRHWFVIFVTILTVGLWVSFKFVENQFGDMGTIGLIPVILIFGSGVLSTKDFNSLDWNILMLLGGGAALGTAVKQSRLLFILSTKLEAAFDQYSLYSVYCLFNLIIMLITNFISHTVGAMTMLPIIAEFGKQINHPKLLVVSGVLSCSAACCLPVSSFPNIIVYSMRKEDGTHFLNVKDYIQTGILYQISYYILLITGGYWLMTALHF